MLFNVHNLKVDVILILETRGHVFIVECANIMTTLHLVALMQLVALLIPRLIDDATV